MVYAIAVLARIGAVDIPVGCTATDNRKIVIRGNGCARHQVEDACCHNAAVGKLESSGGNAIVIAAPQVQVHAGIYILGYLLIRCPCTMTYGQRLFYKPAVNAGFCLLTIVEGVEFLLNIALRVA